MDAAAERAWWIPLYFCLKDIEDSNLSGTRVCVSIKILVIDHYPKKDINNFLLKVYGIIIFIK